MGFKWKVGSEEFKAACKALVPDSVIANCTTFEERLDAIDDYLKILNLQIILLLMKMETSQLQ